MSYWITNTAFTALGVFHDAEVIPLGMDSFYLASPTRAACS